MRMHAFDKLHEECGVFGIYLKDGKTGVVPAAYHALYALQHRGQESCGIAVNNDGVIDCYKDVGLVNEVFTRDVLEKLHEGSMTGHPGCGLIQLVILRQLLPVQFHIF